MDEHRDQPRYRLRWEVVILLGPGRGRILCRGKTQNVSLSGIAVMGDVNLSTPANFTVLLFPPPLHKGDPVVSIEASAHPMYTVYAAEEMCFRIGLQFDRFVGDSHERLRERLTYHKPSAAA